MIVINDAITLADNDIEMSAVRAQGAGGQNVNKVSSAIYLRFDIKASSLNAEIKQRLLHSHDSRITKQGILVIKAQQYRTQERNKSDALSRLREFIIAATHQSASRKPTKPSRQAKRNRVDNKVKRGQTKALRAKVKH